MKTLTLIALFLSAQVSAAITLDEILDTKNNYVLKDSRGPSYRDNLQIEAMSAFKSEIDLNNYIDDGLNHDAYDKCEPDAYIVDAAEILDWPHIDFKIQSVKKNGKGRSVAYAMIPVVHYEVTYTYYPTEEHYDSSELPVVETVDCPITDDFKFYFENTKDKSINYLGSTR